MTLVTSFLIVLAFPAITIALVELMFDRLFGTNFFDRRAAADPILWQHLFWVFGHPEVYILILPAMGIVSEILPTFSRKPLFGYPIVVFSRRRHRLPRLRRLGHHMFTTGMGTIATAAFALTTMAIAVPTGVKIFNWIGTLWGGSLNLRHADDVRARLHLDVHDRRALRRHARARRRPTPSSNDSYFVVAHFHYVLFGGSIFGLFAASTTGSRMFSGPHAQRVLGQVPPSG